MKDLDKVLGQLPKSRGRRTFRPTSKKKPRASLTSDDARKIRDRLESATDRNNDPMFSAIAKINVVGQIEVTFRIDPTDVVDFDIPEEFTECDFAEVPCLNQANTDGAIIDQQNGGTIVPGLLIDQLAELKFKPIRITERYRMENYPDRIFMIRFLHQDFIDKINASPKIRSTLKKHMDFMQRLAAVTWGRCVIWKNPENQWSPYQGSVVIQLRHPIKADPKLQVKVDANEEQVEFAGYAVPQSRRASRSTAVKPVTTATPPRRKLTKK